MDKPIVISINRKLAMALSAAALLLAVFGCSLFFFDKDEETEADAVIVSIQKDRLIEEDKRSNFVAALPKGVIGLILLSEDEKKNPVLTPLGPDAKPRNLCGKTSKGECKLNTNLRALTSSFALTGDRSTCEAGGVTRYCHTTGTHAGKYDWHQAPDNKRHFPCPAGCE